MTAFIAAVLMLTATGLVTPARAQHGPAGIADDLALWLRADSVFTDSNCTDPATPGEQVACWHDLSGNGNVARGAETDRISAVSDRLNDQPVIRFSGGYFSVPTFVPDDDNPESAFLSPVTAFAVYDKPEEGGPYFQRIIASVGGGCVDYKTDSIYRTLGSGDADEDNILDALPAPILYSTDHNGESRYYSRLLIGEVAKTIWSCATSLDLHADIAEVLLYTRTLEAYEHGAVRNYLALRYGVGNTTSADPAIESGRVRTHLLGETGAVVSFREAASATDGALEALAGTDPDGAAPPGIAYVYPDRYWTMSQTGLSGFTYEVSFDLSRFTTAYPDAFSDLRILWRESAAGMWTDVSEEEDVRLYYEEPFVTATGLSAFGEFAIGSVSMPHLPACEGIAVVTPDDSGPGSLRQAILNANATAEADTICFDIPGDGPHTIQLSSALPAITQPVVIDGYTQPGAQPNTQAVGSDAVLMIELDGSSAGDDAHGIHLTGSGITVRGLAIGNFDGDLVHISGGSENIVEGSYIGTDASGTQAREGNSGVWIEAAADNLIGGDTPAARNVIAGDLGGGFFIKGDAADGNRLLNNYIGTDPTGTEAVGDNGGGIFVLGADDTVIGAPGAGNLVAGIDGGRIFVIAEDGPAERTIIQATYVGTNAVGDDRLGDSGGGVFILGAPHTLLGGTTPGAGNLISGEDAGGVFIADEHDGATGMTFGSDSTVVQGNLIGTDATGTVALGNCCGIDVSGSVGVLIGGTVEGARNVISGNSSDGISVQDSTIIQGNYIGVDITGTKPLGNGFGGIWVSGNDNLIGGTEEGAGNVIAATGPDDEGSGIILRFGASGNVIQGNFIGTDETGTIPLGNGHGIYVERASDNQIGGTEPGAGNAIAFNTGAGIYITGPDAVGNRILGNRIYDNGGPGIDLFDGSGETPNDAGDADEGPNNLQNAPELIDYRVEETGDLLVDYRVDSDLEHAAYPLRIEFFVADDDGEEGRAFIGFDEYAENDHGDGAAPGLKTANLGNAAEQGVSAGSLIVATATDADGNTSAFSTAVTLVSTGDEALLPEAFALEAAYPNPFNPQAIVPYDVPEYSRVRITVYDVLGREIERLVDADHAPGRYEVALDGTRWSSGMYVVRMQAGGTTTVRSVVLTK